MKIEFKKEELVPTMAKVGEFIGSLAEQKDYVLEIKPKPKRRSLDANAYMWALIGKLQAELAKNDPQITKDEIYQGYVRQYGKSVDYQLPDSAVNAMTKSWGRNGLGWTAEKESFLFCQFSAFCPAESSTVSSCPVTLETRAR